MQVDVCFPLIAGFHGDATIGLGPQNGTSTFLYVSLKNIRKKWTMPARNWNKDLSS
jgi:hypothetical protein